MPNQEQSYYKILGTTANIGQRRIKEKYINAVRQHPPETDPEQFEKIREAYETLKDPVKRKQYDIGRKYGGDIEKMLHEADEHALEEDYEKAKAIYRDILQIYPDSFSAQTSLMFTELHLSRMENAYQMLEKLLHSPILEEDDTLPPSIIYATFGKTLMDKGHFDEAVDFLEKGRDRFPDEMLEINKLLSFAYLTTNQNEKALQTAEQILPPSETESSIQDIDLYQTWLFAITNTHSWSQLSKVQARFRKYLKNLQDPQDREEAYSILSAEYLDLLDMKRYRHAETVLAMATVLDSQDQETKEDLKEVRRLARGEKEINKLLVDEDIFPLMIQHGIKWFFDDDDHPLVRELDHMITPDIINELEAETDYYAAGILKLQKKYPALYQLFKSDWDALYRDLTKDMNREAKRGLKKLM